VFSDLLEELTAKRLNVINVDHRNPFTEQQSPHPCFPLDQWQRPQVFAVQEEQVEREEHTIPSAEQQVFEHRTARIIDARNLAIEDGILEAKISTGPLCQILEIAERVAVP